MLWQPLLMRSMITLLFGLITVFFGISDVVGLSLNIGWYFLLLAAVQFWFVKRLDLDSSSPRRTALWASAGILAIAGVVIFISINLSIAAWVAAAALALSGFAELFAAFYKSPGQVSSANARPAPIASDWVISGILTLGTGLLLPFFIGIGAHAVLGVVGGGALILGTLWLLSALTMRHDARGQKRQ